MYPWPEPIWQPGEVAFSTVRSGGVHVVRLRVHPASTLDLAWQRLSQTLRADDDVLLEGGGPCVACQLTSSRSSAAVRTRWIPSAGRST